MTKASSRVIPFIVIAIVGLALLYEAETGKRVDIEAYMPVLVALGVGGAAKSAIQRAADAHKGITSSPDFDEMIAKYPGVKKKIIDKANELKKGDD